MPEALSRNFNNFVLGDNVFELGGGVIQRIAERAGLEVSAGPSSDMLFGLVGIIGKNKRLQHNEPIDFLTPLGMAWYLDKSQAMLPLNRSLWTPDQGVPEGIDRVMTGGMANWQDRAASLLVAKADRYGGERVYMPTGDRVMDTKTEVVNPNVIQYIDEYGKHPKEHEYAEKFVAPRLMDAGFEVVMEGHLADPVPEGSDEKPKPKSGDEIAEQFVKDHPELFATGKQLSYVRVANAAIQLAGQFRTAARAAGIRYDTMKHKPQVFVETDTVKVARSPRQRADSAHFQAPQAGLRQLVLTAKTLHEAAGGR